MKRAEAKLKASHQKIPSSYPETYDASPGSSLQGWINAVEWWKAADRVPEELVGARMMKSLKGSAAVICRKLKPQDVADANGQDLIVKTLQGHHVVKDREGRGCQQQNPQTQSTRWRGHGLIPGKAVQCQGSAAGFRARLGHQRKLPLLACTRAFQGHQER